MLRVEELPEAAHSSVKNNLLVSFHPCPPHVWPYGWKLTSRLFLLRSHFLVPVYGTLAVYFRLEAASA